jgi:glycosyltransferase involved in cell wall biosynthesis
MLAETSSATVVVNQAAMVPAPLISVHMITYGHEPYLAEAIEGVMRQQTEYSFELLIGEDCSRDRTREIALAFQRRHPDKIAVIYSGSNVGALANSERVFQRTRGKYVAFCEGDDYWHDASKLQKQVSFLEAHPDHVLVHSAYRVQAGQTIEPSGGVTPHQVPASSVFESLLGDNFIATCTVCMRRSVAASYYASKFRAMGYLMDDYPHWLFASRQGLIGYNADILATYRIVAGSYCRRGPAHTLRMALAGRRATQDFIAEYGCSSEALSRSRNRMNLSIMRAAFCARDRETFLREYQWYKKNNPAWRRDYRTRIGFVAAKLHLGGAFRVFQMLRDAIGMRRDLATLP